MRRIIPFLLLALVAAPVLAQFSDGLAVRGVPLFLDYDPGTSYVFCKYTGANQDAWGAPLPAPKKIKTSGSSTTTTSFDTVTDDAFLGIDVGDWIQVTQSQAGSAQGVPMPRYVLTNADDDTITVNAAWNLSIQTTGYSYVFRKQSCGTGAENGWVNTRGVDLVRYSLAVDQIAAASVDVVVQCRDTSAVSTPVALVTKSYTAVGGDGILVSGMLYDQCRFGMKVTTDAGAQKVTVSLRGI